MKEKETCNFDDICWGRNPVFSLLEESPQKCTKVLIGKNIQPHIRARIEELCHAAKINFMLVDVAVLNRLSSKENHQGLVAYISPVKLWDVEEMLPKLPAPPSPVMVLLCDHVQDPHNLGAMIRSAEIAGASAVVMPKRGGCLPTGTVVKTSSGAALRLPLAKTGNIAQTIKLFQAENFWTIGLSMGASENLFKNDMPPRLLVVIGAEGAGLSQLAAKTCDELRHIPMRGKTGSLNASVAAALAMFEWTRNN